MNKRRDFLKAGIAAGFSLTVIPSFARKNEKPVLNSFLLSGDPEEIAYEQQPLPYSYNELEPAIDAMTMEIHYSRHAAGYAKNLADAIKAENVDPKTEKLSSLLSKISKYSVKMRNNAGGHYNHEFFWKTMKKPSTSETFEPKLQKAIVRDFGSMEAFKTEFSDAAKNRFGSGWAWLVMNKDEKLIVGSTPNQDNPLMDVSDFKGIPLLGLDVWEHAYYLKYQNKRPDYITAWWSTVNWEVVGKRFQKAD